MAAWNEPAAQVEPGYDPDDPEYLDQCRQDRGSAELKVLDYWHDARMASDAEFWFAEVGHSDYLAYLDGDDDRDRGYSSADDQWDALADADGWLWDGYDYPWDDAAEESAIRQNAEAFAHDDSGDAGHYAAIWIAVGYVQPPTAKYIPFPYPVRAVVDGKLVECYRP